MTHSHSGDIVKKLTEEGYRLTPQRLMTISAIEQSDGHISAWESAEDVPSALSQALALAGGKDLVCLAGSLFIVGEAIEASKILP